jgi:hypothetical protein
MIALASSISNLIKTIEGHFVIFNLALAFVFAMTLIYLVAASPYRTESYINYDVIIYAMATFFCAGGVGGAACNLRGIFEYYMENEKLPASYFEPYGVRPWMGACSGLIAFFVLSFLNTALSDSNSMAWTTFPGRIPYIGISLLAGFGSHEFMERVKEIVKTTFSVSANEQQNAVSATTIGTWTSEGAGPEKLDPVKENEIVMLSGILENKKYAGKIFNPGETPSKPEGKAIAIRFSGGDTEKRLASAQEYIRLRSEEEGKPD